MCQRKGSLLWFVPRDQLRVTKGEDAPWPRTPSTSMSSSTGSARSAGSIRSARAGTRKGNAIAAINIRCLEGIELDSVAVQHYDGRSI